MLSWEKCLRANPTKDKEIEKEALRILSASFLFNSVAYLPKPLYVGAHRGAPLGDLETKTLVL